MNKKGDKIARAEILNAKQDDANLDYDPKKVSELAELALIKEIDSVDDINDLEDLDDDEKDLLVRAIGSASVEEPNIQFANKEEEKKHKFKQALKSLVIRDKDLQEDIAEEKED